MQSIQPFGPMPMGPFTDRLAVDAQLLGDDILSEARSSSTGDQGSTCRRSPGQFVDVHPRFLWGELVVWRLPTHPAERGWTTTFRGRRPGRSQLALAHPARDRFRELRWLLEERLVAALLEHAQRRRGQLLDDVRPQHPRHD